MVDGNYDWKVTDVDNENEISISRANPLEPGSLVTIKAWPNTSVYYPSFNLYSTVYPEAPNPTFWESYAYNTVEDYFKISDDSFIKLKVESGELPIIGMVISKRDIRGSYRFYEILTGQYTKTLWLPEPEIFPYDFNDVDVED